MNVKASHDEIMIRLIDRRDDASASEPRPLIVPTGSRLQDVLSEVLADATDDVEVTVNGRSASRLNPLLAGDLIEIQSRQ